MAEHDQRRRHPRFTVEGVHGRLALSTSVDILNLSLGGIAIKAEKRLNIGQSYALKLDMDERELTIHGIVVWSVLSGVEKRGAESLPVYSAGLTFTDVLSDRAMELVEFIDHHKVAADHRLSGVRFRLAGSARAALSEREHYDVKLISRSGMLIETDKQLEVDQVYAMELVPQEGRAIRFSGRVASLVPSPGPEGGRHRIGVEFVDMSHEDRASLDTLIARISCQA